MIEIGGRDVSHLPPAARDFGIVFQSYALFPEPDRRGQCRLRPRQPPRRRAPQIDARVAELLALVGLTEQGSQISGAAFRRPAAARRARARARDLARPAAARRAALRARCARAAAAARRDQGAAAPARRHHHHGDARPGRGARDGRPHRGDEPGRDRAGRHAAGDLSQAGDRLRRRLRRHHDVPRRRGGRRRAAARSARSSLPATSVNGFQHGTRGAHRAAAGGGARAQHRRDDAEPDRDARRRLLDFLGSFCRAQLKPEAAPERRDPGRFLRQPDARSCRRRRARSSPSRCRRNRCACSRRARP